MGRVPEMHRTTCVTTDLLLHLVGASEWTLDDDRYAPGSLTAEGFIHLSAPHQVHRVADARFAGRDDLLLLVIDPNRLDVEVVWEDASGEGEEFPHAYGSVPRSAIVAVHAYQAGADGRFPPAWQVSERLASHDEASGEPHEALRFVDLSRSGHHLGRGRLTDLPARLPLRELLERRVRAEVAAYNAEPGPVYVGLVQPHDAMRYSDGARMSSPRQLDADVFAAAVREALDAGMLYLRAGQRALTAPDDEVAVADLDEVTVVLHRPVVAHDV